MARISQAIRNRKKPLLLAAAAIVLAIGALQLFGLSHGSSKSVAEAKIEAPLNPLPQGAKTRDFVAADAQPAAAPLAAPQPDQPALISPPPDPKTAIVMAEPDKVAGRFAEAAVTPAADGFNAGDADKPADAAPPAVAPDNAAAATDSEEASPTGAIGSDKLKAAAAAGDPAAAFEIATRYAKGCRRTCKPRSPGTSAPPIRAM